MIGLLLVVIVGAGFALAVRRRRWGGDAVAVASSLLAPPARAWFEAMRAEHAAIDDQRERRRFARGCVVALMVGPLPADRTGSAMRSALAGAIMAVTALAVFGLVHYPDLRSGPWLVYVAVFAVALAACALLGSRCALLGSPRARRIGLIAGVPAVGLAAVAADASGPLSVMPALLLPLLPAIGAWLASRRDGSVGSGVAAAATCGVLAGLLAFVGFVTVTYVTGGGSPTPTLLAQFRHSGMHDYATWAVGDNLGGAVFLLGLVPIVGSVLGVAASSLAAPRPLRRSNFDTTSR